MEDNRKNQDEQQKEQAYFQTAAHEARQQAEAGFAVELEPELADAMGVFEETAVSEADVEADMLNRHQHQEDDNE